MGSSKAPKTPDYVGAANAQGAANIEAARATGKMNNPIIYNPYGTQSVSWSGDTPIIQQTLNPAEQALLDKERQGKLIASDAAISAANQIKRTLGTNLDFSKMPGAPQSSGQRRDDVIASMMARIDTDTAGQRDAKNSELIAAGIRPGTRAYSAAMDQIDRQYNDARNNAILAGGQEATRDFGMDMQSRQQAIAELLQQRQTPINELNALMSGSQINNPFAGNLGFQAGANVGAAPIANAITSQGQAQQNIYNQNQAQQNANIQAGAGLIGSLGSAYFSRPGQ